jgi:NADPH:quinone reductase-like Zn-dependent oxidoreductase
VVQRMQAAMQDRYGGPDALEVQETEVPTIGDDGVLVRVRASSVNAVDWHLMRGQPLLARMGEGFRRPKTTIRGIDVAGTVEAVGKDVTELQPGDKVFGNRSGAFAELVAGRVRNFVPKPANLTFEEAAAMPVAATTALQGVRDHGHVDAGQRVLVLGGGGGVGSFTVQIAKAFGAQVTATTSAPKLEMVRALGADDVVDYTREDVTRTGRRFDVVLDVGGYARLKDLRRVCAPPGAVVLVGAGSAKLSSIAAGIITAKLRSRFRGERTAFYLATPNRDDLLVLAELARDGRIRSVIDRTYPLSEVAAAVGYMETGQAHGKVVITI